MAESRDELLSLGLSMAVLAAIIALDPVLPIVIPSDVRTPEVEAALKEVESALKERGVLPGMRTRALRWLVETAYFWAKAGAKTAKAVKERFMDIFNFLKQFVFRYAGAE